jgi:hypothetical protein
LEEDTTAMESAKKMKYSSLLESTPRKTAKIGREFIIFKKSVLNHYLEQ